MCWADQSAFCSPQVQTSFHRLLAMSQAASVGSRCRMPAKQKSFAVELDVVSPSCEARSALASATSDCTSAPLRPPPQRGHTSCSRVAPSGHAMRFATHFCTQPLQMAPWQHARPSISSASQHTQHTSPGPSMADKCAIAGVTVVGETGAGALFRPTMRPSRRKISMVAMMSKCELWYGAEG